MELNPNLQKTGFGSDPQEKSGCDVCTKSGSDVCSKSGPDEETKSGSGSNPSDCFLFQKEDPEPTKNTRIRNAAKYPSWWEWMTGARLKGPLYFMLVFVLPSISSFDRIIPGTEPLLYEYCISWVFFAKTIELKVLFLILLLLKEISEISTAAAEINLAVRLFQFALLFYFKCNFVNTKGLSEIYCPL